MSAARLSGRQRRRGQGSALVLLALVAASSAAAAAAAAASDPAPAADAAAAAAKNPKAAAALQATAEAAADAANRYGAASAEHPVETAVAYTALSKVLVADEGAGAALSGDRAAAAPAAAELTPEQRAQQAQLDRLWERLPSTVQRPWRWDGSGIAAVVLSVLVSLTSSVDRQGGASLYVAIFAVLLRFRMRQAVALVSLTVFLGSLAPAAAAFCDPILTERGVLSLPDLPGALVILPAIYYGISWGVIVNALLPEWLLTLLVVFVLFASNLELLVAIVRVLGARREMRGLWERLRCELARARGEAPPPPLASVAGRRRGRDEAASGGSSRFAAFRAGRWPSSALADASASGDGDDSGNSKDEATIAAAAATATADGAAVNGAITADCTGSSESHSSRGSGSGSGSGANPAAAAAADGPQQQQQQQQDRPLSAAERADRAAALARAKDAAVRLRHLRRRTEEIEALALVYPAFHIPTVRDALEGAAAAAAAGGKGARHQWTAAGALQAVAEEEGSAAAESGGPPSGLERAALELLSGEGDGHEQDVAAALARQETVTGADALAAGGLLSGGGGAAADASSAADAAPAPSSAPANARKRRKSASPTSSSSRMPRLTPKKVWRLQNKFELLLLLKVVVFHLATEAIRHATAHPCTRRFWVMLGGFAAAVTIFLCVVVTSYSRRRLWRGPRWLGGREAVIAERRREQEEQAEAARRGDVEGAAGGAEDGDEATAAAAAAPPRGCWPRFAAWRAAHSPFAHVPAREAITRLDACSSTDGYRGWTKPRIAALALLAFPVGVFSSASGMAGGPIQAQLLLLLKLKPHVVAGTSRVLLSAFTLGTAVAYAVAGNLQLTYGLVFGLSNLVLAPLGLMIFKRLRLPTYAVLLLSLAMGLLSIGALAARRLAPELSLVAHAAAGRLKLPPDEQFAIGRFCHGNY